jgi:hypothetical protein
VKAHAVSHGPTPSEAALFDLRTALGSFRLEVHRMTAPDLERAMALLLVEADYLLRSGRTGIMGRGDALKWCEQLAHEAPAGPRLRPV